MTSYSVNMGQDQYPVYSQNMDSQNVGFDRNRDTEMLDMTGVVENNLPRRKPFDWCILSVLGYMCCAPIGLCAMYYAMRTNHGHDHNIEGYKIDNSGTKAKVLTILSIVLGSLCILAMIITVAVLVNSAMSSLEKMYNENDRYGK